MAKEEKSEETYIQDAGVVLIHHGDEFIDKVVDVLKCYEYKVMTVGMTSTSMTMHSNEKGKIDAIMINSHLLDFPSMKLLRQVVTLKIISLSVCNEPNEQDSVMKSLNIGTYIVVEKPLDENIIDDLWQFVLRKKIKQEKVGEGFEENGVMGNVDGNGNNNVVGHTEEQHGRKNTVPKIEEQSNNGSEVENIVVSNEKCKLRKKRGKMINLKVVNENIGKKSRTLWTDDLHAKFMKVVQHLGEGKCFPKQILEFMDVPGLTRQQVASHLQKCRNNNCKVPKALKNKHPASSSQGNSSGSQQRGTFKKLGRMPPLQTSVSNQIQRGPEFPFPTINTNHIFARGESSVQRHVQFSTTNPINNPNLYIQNNVDSGIQKQDGPSFRMSSTEGLIIESIDNNHELVPHVMDDYAQNGYNLNTNVTKGTTSPDRTMMAGTNVGAAIANFQHYFNVPNMSGPSNVVAAQDVGDSNEKKTDDAYFDFDDVHFSSDDMDFLRRFLESSSDLPNEQNGEFDQVYSDYQVAATQNVQFSEVANFPNHQVTKISSAQFEEEITKFYD